MRELGERAYGDTQFAGSARFARARVAVGGNDARFINHSCTPNCYAQIVDGVIWIRASKTIEPGDELTYNYQTDGEKSIQCECRTGCRTRL